MEFKVAVIGCGALGKKHAGEWAKRDDAEVAAVYDPSREAAEAYEDSVDRAEESGGPRDVAVGKGQLGTVRMLQRRFDEAMQVDSDSDTTLVGRFRLKAQLAGCFNRLGGGGKRRGMDRFLPTAPLLPPRTRRPAEQWKKQKSG